MIYCGSVVQCVPVLSWNSGSGSRRVAKIFTGEHFNCFWPYMESIALQLKFFYPSRPTSAPCVLSVFLQSVKSTQKENELRWSTILCDYINHVLYHNCYYNYYIVLIRVFEYRSLSAWYEHQKKLAISNDDWSFVNHFKMFYFWPAIQFFIYANNRLHQITQLVWLSLYFLVLVLIYNG